jgi:SAM-dependent methyltransferase
VTALYQPGMVHSQTSRSFFGVHKVTESVDGRFRMLFHGTTLHGVERLREETGEPVVGKPEPLTYYYKNGPIAETIAATREQRGKLERVAVVGLGTGSMACHARSGESFRFFEIDRAVVRIASDPAKFRFLAECGGADNIVLGDARLTLPEEREPFDLIVLDAFSSDVVPVHLLTREALAQYLGRLKEGGVVAFHISNRYLELQSVIAEVAATYGLVTLVKRDYSAIEDEHGATMYAGSLVAVVGRSEAELAVLSAKPGWRKRVPDGKTVVWTDDYSNVLAAIWRLQAGK